MNGFRVANDTMADQILAKATGQSEGWLRGYVRCVAAANYTIGQQLAHAHGMPVEVISNDSQQSRIRQAEQYLAQGAAEELQGFLAGWVAYHRTEDLTQVIWNQGEGQPADPQLRAAMASFLREGQLG